MPWARRILYKSKAGLDDVEELRRTYRVKAKSRVTGIKRREEVSWLSRVKGGNKADALFLL
jgi:hypothetical protein